MIRRRIILKQQSLSASENRDASKHLTFNLLCILLQEANKQLTIQCKNKSGRSLAYKYSRLRGTQREYSSKPHKHSIVERTLVFKR